MSTNQPLKSSRIRFIIAAILAIGLSCCICMGLFGFLSSIITIESDTTEAPSWSTISPSVANTDETPEEAPLGTVISQCRRTADSDSCNTCCRGYEFIGSFYSDFEEDSPCKCLDTEEFLKILGSQ